MAQELDLLDKKILYELDLNSRQPISELAKNVRSSRETVNFRLNRLIKNGYIKKFVTTLYTSNLNRFYYKLFYKFYKITPAIEKQIIDFISSYKKTAWFGTFEGPYDMAFLIIAKSLYDLNNFLIEFKKLFGDYILEQEIHTLTSVHRFNLKFTVSLEDLTFLAKAEIGCLEFKSSSYKIFLSNKSNSWAILLLNIEFYI